MIPILFSEEETTFLTNGLGRLSDAISCTVTEERNGAYELKMEYPINGVHYTDITLSRIVYAVPSDGKDSQPFRIYKIEKLINGRVRIYAEHISYQARYMTVMPFSASTAAAAMVGLAGNIVCDNPFVFWTDIEKAGSYVQEVPESIRERLGGQEGSILDVYGGEYEWDRWTIKLHANRGQDRGVTLRYGKNITDLTQENNIASTYTAVCPFYKASEDEDLIYLSDYIVKSEYADNYPFIRIKNVDMTDDFEDDEEVTESALRQKARAYITANNIGIPDVSIKVSFVALWQTEEYKTIAPLERVNLCDTVTVIFEKLGVKATAKVIKTVYNVLSDRYDSIEIGEAKSTMSNKVATQTKQIEQEMSSEMERAAKHATDLLAGGLGGYIVFRRNAKGKPEELLIMDTDNIQTATKVWRFNKAGWGYSGTGYDGPYTLAATQDGAIVADFITVGTLTANIIKAGILTDKAGKFSLNMTTGTLKMQDGEFSGTITGSEVNGGTITGSTIQNAKTGPRVLMDSSSSLKGYQDNTLHNLINMANRNSNNNDLIIDADHQMHIRTPGLYVVNQSYGTGGGTVYETRNDSVEFVYEVGKRHSTELWVANAGEEEGEVYCMLPALLEVKYASHTVKNGMWITGRTTRSDVVG